MSPVQRPLCRNEASTYLFDRWGISRKPATLAKLACIGGGPVFRRANRSILYERVDLDAWAGSILSPPMSSTSEFL